MLFYPIYCVGMDINLEHQDARCFFYWIGMDIDIVTCGSLCCFGPSWVLSSSISYNQRFIFVGF
jgi:hypothetical protein